MKRIFAALLALALAAANAAAVAAPIVFENLHYGQEAFDLHISDQPNVIVFEGEEYSLNDDAVSYEGVVETYGGKTRAVYEMTVPDGGYAMPANGEAIVLGEWMIDIPYRAELWIAQGNRISGEYEIEGPITLTDVYREQVTIPFDAAGNPLLIDRIYLYRYEVGETVHRMAATLYIDYEGYHAARPAAAQSVSAKETSAVPYAAAAVGLLAVGSAVVMARRKRKPAPVAVETPEEDFLSQGREMLAALQAEADIRDEAVRQKAEQLRNLFAQLLETAQNHAQNASALRKFITYYLPAAQKMLHFWRSMEGHEVEEAKREEAHDSVIRGLEMIIDACRSKLNNLHGTELMDISTDLAALEQVLVRDGVRDSGLKLQIKKEEP